MWEPEKGFRNVGGALKLWKSFIFQTKLWVQEAYFIYLLELLFKNNYK